MNPVEFYTDCIEYSQPTGKIKAILINNLILRTLCTIDKAEGKDFWNRIDLEHL